uniref:Uncharacterized protein n=1 Tax=Felis catus TaxID=9685 RepID=A0ABI7YBF7_FELCA
AHVKQQVEVAIEEFHSKEVHLGVLLAPSILPLLGFAVSEEDQAVGLGGAEVKGDGTHAFGVPLGQTDVRLWGLEVDGVQCGHILTLEYNLPIDLHLGVPNPGQARQLQTDVIILINNLSKAKQVPYESILQTVTIHCSLGTWVKGPRKDFRIQYVSNNMRNMRYSM